MSSVKFKLYYYFFTCNSNLFLPARPRGFGQLVRAKNIRTVGDLSSLKPLDIKTLPIRSPKITNVKKALQLYEAQVCPFKSNRMLHLKKSVHYGLLSMWFSDWKMASLRIVI